MNYSFLPCDREQSYLMPPSLRDRLPLEVLDQKCVLHIVGQTIDWYAAHVQKGERFGKTLDRVGVDKLARCLST